MREDWEFVLSHKVPRMNMTPGGGRMRGNMSVYGQNELVEMAYRYLVLGEKQADIEESMGLPEGTVSSELKPYRITGQKNVEGRGGWGKRGNHCGVAAPDNIGYEVTREDIRKFMFHQNKTLEEFLDKLGRQKKKYATEKIPVENGADRLEQNSTGKNSTGKNSTESFEVAVAVVVLVVLISFLRRILKGIGMLLGYVIPIGLFSLIVFAIFHTLMKQGQAKPQSAGLGAYAGYFMGSAAITAVFVIFKNIFLNELNETWSLILLLAGYASIIYAIILFVWRFVLGREKVNDLVKKLDILYAGYVLGVVLLAVFAGLVDGITAKIMIGIYIAAIGVIVTA